MKYSIACCFLTHNHPDIVKDILDKCLKIYANFGVDIFFYDDSDDDATKQIAEKKISEGASNLFYIDVHSAINGDHKYYLILQGYGLPKDYDYIWLVRIEFALISPILKDCAPQSMKVMM